MYAIRSSYGRQRRARGCDALQCRRGAVITSYSIHYTKLYEDRRAIALSLLVFFLYGSMFWGIFPTDPGVSFESHFFGALIGTILAFLFRNKDPASVDKRYSWEDEENESDRVEFDTKQDDSHRITSYNVCYTKLLRVVG